MKFPGKRPRLLPAEWAAVGAGIFAVLLLWDAHLSAPLPTDFKHGEIHWLIMFLGLEAASLPAFLGVAAAAWKHLGRIQKAENPAELAAGWREEWEALKRGLGVMREWAPLFFFMAGYWYFGILPALLKIPNRDALLAAWDLRLFGAHYSILAQRFYNPVLTAFMNFAYFMHPILVPLFLVVLYFQKEDRTPFRKVMLFLMTVALIGFTAYVLVPAYGPYIYLRSLYTHEVRDPFVAAFVDVSRAPLDAFPSLHVAISSGMLVYEYRYARWFFWIVLPLVAGNWLSTIYLRYHYTVDDIAGFAAAALAVALTEAAFRVWEKKGWNRNET